MTVLMSCCISHYIPISTAFLYFQKDLALSANPFLALISQFFSEKREWQHGGVLSAAVIFNNIGNHLQYLNKYLQDRCCDHQNLHCHPYADQDSYFDHQIVIIPQGKSATIL